MHREDLLAAALVWPIDQDLAVEPPGAQQRRIEDLRPVGRSEQDETARRIEPIELGQQLVQRLVLLVLPTHAERTASTAERVELVDEDDRRRVLASLLEQVAHPCGANADKHLDELRPGDRKERYSGLAGDGTGEQCLAGPRWADEQHALGRPAAEAPVSLGVLQEVDNLDQLLLGLVDTSDVGKGDLGRLLDIDLGAALADRHQPAEPALPHPSDREHPDADKEDRRQNPGEQIGDPMALDDPAIGDPVLVKTFGELGWLNPRRNKVLQTAGFRLFQGTLDLVLRYRDLFDLVFVEEGLEAAVRDRSELGALQIQALNEQHQEHGGDHVPEMNLLLLLHAAHPR